ncbi:MAG: hypothetical protein EOO66_32805, partial [Methylobacterium sp.]
VTDDRTAGFLDQLKAKNATGIEVVFQQTADFTREKGKSVTETLLRAHPDVNAIYAENDEMGLGALAALDDAGKAGTDSVHIVSIDGTKGAVQAIVEGNFDAVIESNPAYGPSAQAALDAYVNGDGAMLSRTSRNLRTEPGPSSRRRSDMNTPDHGQITIYGLSQE